MTKIKTFYDSRMNCKNNSYSPSSEKPGKAVADWLEQDLIEIAAFEPASLEDLRSAHGFYFVNAMLAGSQPTGFGLPSAEIAESTRWTVGSMMAAALHAVSEQTITCSPSSGFHHAKYTEAANYCTFNGLVIAALKAIKLCRLSRVGILDLDWHAGDGTQDILNELSLHDQIVHCSSGMQWPKRVSDYFEWLESAIEKLSESVELVLFQAGADAHRNDPLGGLLSTEEMRERDELAFSLFTKHGIPMAWNLAGGYQRDAEGRMTKVLELHRLTMIEAQKAVRSRKNPTQPVETTTSELCEPIKPGIVTEGLPSWMQGGCAIIFVAKRPPSPVNQACIGQEPPDNAVVISQVDNAKEIETGKTKLNDK